MTSGPAASGNAGLAALAVVETVLSSLTSTPNEYIERMMAVAPRSRAELNEILLGMVILVDFLAVNIVKLAEEDIDRADVLDGCRSMLMQMVAAG